ncbi:MAG: 50S ribosomal protein L6 [archaeon]
MKKHLTQTIEIPEGVEATLEEELFTVKGPEGENKRKFNFENLDVKKNGSKIIIENKKANKRDKRMMNTIAARMRNMIKGVQEKWEYKLKVCSSHFPISIKQEGRRIEVKNFLGEKIPRNLEIPEGVDVRIDRDIITLTSIDKELTGQAAANFEAATKIRGRDKRVFQDGIWITHKAGREM